MIRCLPFRVLSNPSSLKPLKPEFTQAHKIINAETPLSSFPLVYIYLGVLSSINKELNTSGLAVVVESSTKELRNASRRDAELPCV